MSQEANVLLFTRVAALLSVLCQKLRRAQILSSRTEELLDDAARSLAEVHDLIRRAAALPPDPGHPPRPVGLPQPSDRVRPASPPEAFSVNLVHRADGSAMAHVNRVGVPLAPFLAALLDILKAEGGIVTDHFVGWKSIADIQFALKQSTKQNSTPPAVKELVFRLRNELEQHGLSRSLVQTNRRLGYRFAVRRKAETLTESDNH